MQASVYGKIVARETLKARRKDVTANLYGEIIVGKGSFWKIKKEKGKLKDKGRIRIPSEAYFKVLE